MCGIAGLVSYTAPVERPPLLAFTEGIAHRGPDDCGIHLSATGQCGLAHTRLSIIDLSSSAHQPMVDPASGNAIVFNGEIYNFASLRARCEQDGYRFASHSDTEVILALYRMHGTQCLAQLRGMFAFAIWDEARKRLFFARDRLGKKPFNYAHGEQGFAFCSEIDPLARHAWTDRELDLQALDYFLQLQTIPAPLTIYRGIRKLPPAHFGILDANGLTIERYWQPNPRDKLCLSDDEALDAFEEKFAEAVRLRMVADVPVGALLSGGVDSSLVVALMARYTDTPIRTFSVGFSEAPFDESAYARQAAELCGSLHRPVIMDQPDLAVLENVATHYGEPFGDSSALPSFFVSALARQEVAVVLTGDGGDELLGGYPRYASSEATPLWPQKLLKHARISPMSTVTWMRKYNVFPFRKLHRLVSGYLMADSAPLFMFHGVGSDSERRELLEFAGGDTNLLNWHHDWLTNARQMTDNPIDCMLWLDQHTYLPDDLLVKVDIATMHCGLEARSPFLDHELVEFCARLPVNQKVRGGVGKYLIKKLAERHFPAEFVHRKKMGFGVPLKSWLRGPLASLVQDTLQDPHCMAPLNHQRVLQYLREFGNGAGPGETSRIWVLLMYGLWRRHCYLS